ncbi:MAG TPA: hypothetical protein VGG25_15755 [Streptosporangiaceae bacterium]|jgi:DNA-directed RNA polymerase specialized sigma24 family protein
MDESSGGSQPGSDAELLNQIRSGGPDCYSVLRARHGAAAACLADRLGLGPEQAAGSVDTAFALVLDAIKRGGGPTDAFRPYLLTAVRRAAVGASVPADEQQLPDPGQPLDGPPAAGGLGVPLAAAYLSLPERWRAALWHADIERAAPPDIAPVLGLAAAEVTELTANARAGLRHAYLQHQAGGSGREPAGLSDTGAALRTVVAPMVLGTATAGYLVAIAKAARARGGRARGAAGPVGRIAVGAAAAWAGTLKARLAGSPAQRGVLAAGAGALLAIFGVAGYLLFASSAGGVPTAGQQAAEGVPSPPGASVPADPSTPATSSASPTSPAARKKHHAARHHHAAAPPPAPAPSTPPPARKTSRPQPPAAKVSAEIGVYGPGGHGNMAGVAFGVTNGGPASSRKLTAWIALPGGTKLATWHHHGHAGPAWGHGGMSGWTCTATSQGAVCSHPALAASGRAGWFLAVEVTSSSACGQPVSMTVTGGSAPASAQSSGTIDCGQSGNAPMAPSSTDANPTTSAATLARGTMPGRTAQAPWRP